MPKKWKTKEEYNTYMRTYYWSKKKDEIVKRGGKCENCGESRIAVLRIQGKKKKRVLCENCIRIKKVENVESK